MAFLDSTGEQILERGDSVIVGDYGQYRLGKVVRVTMGLDDRLGFMPLALIKFHQEEAPVIYECRNVTKLTTVGSDQWVRMDCVPPDALPKAGDEIMVLSSKRQYRLARLIEIMQYGVRFMLDDERYRAAQENCFVRFVVGE